MLTRLDATATPFAAGREFGVAGAYEQVTGTALFAVDPLHPANASIVDLTLAPRQPDGRVTFEADLRILRPADPRRGNRRLVLDLVNRGNPVALRNLEAGPAARSDAESDGWLLARGYTLLSCGWQHNVPRGTRRLGLRAPDALDPGGHGLTGQVRAVHQVNIPTQVVGVADEPSGAEHTAYPVADPRDPTATLTERDYPLATGRVVSRERWCFGRLDQGKVVPDRTHVYYADGFVPGKVYEIIYTAEGAPVTGLGFAAVRDAVSFLRFGSRATGNPCADTLDYALAFGASQTGRLARHMLYAGFCVDEAGRLVVDGVLTLIAGPMRTEANWRFGQPSFIGSDSPGFGFPFTDGSQADPRDGSTDGLLQRLSHTHQVPKVMHINTSAEYANLACALIHLSADGSTDAEIPDDVRIYHLAGTHHGGGGLPLTNRLFSGVAAYYNNSVDYRPLLRAAFTNLDRWATQGRLPPPSRYPRLGDGSLVEHETLRRAFQGLPGPGMPAQRLYPTQRIDYGPDASRGLAAFPGRLEATYPDLVPAVDNDGNEVSGIRHPDVAVPLATYTGWNPRHPSIGGSEMNLLLNGATIPFARTAAEGAAAGDPRLSIEQRYASRDDFLRRLHASARDLAAEGYLLEEDVLAVVEASARRYDEFLQLESPLCP